MRLSEIVNTLTAYRLLQSGAAGRGVGAAGKAASADTGAGLTTGAGTPESDGLEWLRDEQDSVELSGVDGAETEEGDDSLGAIVESFIRQRQTYNFTLPGVAGVSSPISVTWEVEQAYRVIQFVPAGQSIDQPA